MQRAWHVFALCICTLAMACSSDSSDGDGGVRDGQPSGDGFIYRDGWVPRQDTAPPIRDTGYVPGIDANLACECDDEIACTIDTCDGDGECRNTLDPNYCLIEGGCYTTGTKNGSQCQICDPATTNTEWTPIVGGCIISGRCYKPGERDGPGGCNICDPSRSVNSWTPFSADCTISGRCYADGDTSTDGCEVCDPSQSTTAWSPRAGGCVIDGRCYDDGDPHPSGSCQTVICDSASSTGGWTVTGDECLVGNTCIPAGEKSADGCEVCNPSQSKTAWSSGTFDCKIDEKCYLSGEKHPNEDCGTVVCDGTVSSSSWTVMGNECLVGSTCYKAGDRVANGCEECIPSQSKTTFSSASYDCQISGGCYRDGEPHPSPTCTSVVCNSATSSSDWTIEGDECLIGDVCYQQGNRTSYGCEECNPSESKTTWSETAYDCRIAGRCYFDGDHHASTTCADTVCDKATSTTEWTVMGDECLIGSTCRQPGDASDSTGCLVCSPSDDAYDWSPAAYACKIGTSCYFDGATHPNATCTDVVCDSTIATTDWTVRSDQCVINNSCVAAGTSHPSASCAGVVSCNTSASKVGWTVTGDVCLVDGQCYANLAEDSTGCFVCDTNQSNSAWTAKSSCSKIVLAALNESHTGDLGGIAGANALCAQQAAAAGYGGTWLALLATATQNISELVPASLRSNTPVVMLNGTQLYSSWDDAMSRGYSDWSGSQYMLRFSGSSASTDAWTGSGLNGVYNSPYDCQGWTDGSSTSARGMTGDWSSRELLNSSSTYCRYSYSVGCIQVPTP